MFDLESVKVYFAKPDGNRVCVCVCGGDNVDVEEADGNQVAIWITCQNERTNPLGRKHLLKFILDSTTQIINVILL